MKKTPTCALLILFVAGSLSGCEGRGSAANAPTQPTVAITGVNTPKSVSVVTAN